MNLTIPNSITTIGAQALKDCSSISGTFTIPSGVTTIGTNPFTNATFENFALASGNTSFVVENNLLMNATKTEIIAYPAGSATESVVIPNTVTTIDQYAFYNSQLVNVTIPASVTKIENYAFALSSKITDVTIPSSVTAIGSFAFSNMTSLGNVYLKATTTPVIGSNAFYGMIGIIHTTSYDIGRNLRTPKTATVYYPPKITVHPYTQELVCPDPGTFTVTVQNGNPTGITYQWYIKEPGAADWRAVTSSDGTGGTTNTFTTGNTTPEMLGTEYRCIVSSAQYPNDNFSRAEIEADTVSKPASLTITGGNFQVDGGLYYPTLQAALEGAGSGTHTISVVTDIEDDSAPVIAADQVITLDMKNKTVTKTVAGITNKGTLTIKNGGTIETINNASSDYRYLITNNGTLNIQETTIQHNGSIATGANAVGNYGTLNMTSGTLKVDMNDTIASKALYGGRTITNFEGILNISGGTVAADCQLVEGIAKVSERYYAYAIECWAGTNNKIGEINISGNVNITSTNQGVVLRYEATDNVSNHIIKMSGGSITAGYYGIWVDTNATAGSIEITGGTITSDDTAIMIESTNAIPVTISNATITSNNGNGIETNVDGSSVTIGTNAVITAAQDGVLFYTDGTNTYTQTAGRVTGGTNGVKFDSYNDDDDARINITGGTIVGTNGNGVEATYNISNVDATFSNATITGANRAINIEASQSNTAITNGTYRTTGTTGISEYGVYIYAFGDLVLTIGETGKNGPTISSGYVGVYIEGNYVANVQVNSASINAKEGIKTAGCASSDLLNANLTVNNATITGTDKAINATGLYTVNINGGNFTGNTCILNLEDDIDLTISGGTFNGQNTGIIATDLTTVTMKDGTIDTLIDGIVSDSRASIIIESGKIYAGQYGIHHKGDASYLTIGVDDATEWVSKVLPEIRATVAVKSPNGFKFYDGILKGITTPNEGDVIDWPDKYGLYTGTETIDSKTYKTLYIAMGWNISADPNVDNVWAFLEKTETGRTLTVEGTGAIKDYAYVDEVYSNIPWAEYHDEIDELIIEQGITVIGARVFANLDKVNTFAIPEGVVEIRTYAFTKSTGANKTVSIPSTVTTIRYNPFARSNIAVLTVSPDNSFYKAIDNVLYTESGKTIVSYSIMKEDAEFTIPSTVTIIGNHVARNANNLTKLIIGENVTTIEGDAFNDAGLKNVYVYSEKITNIESSAFENLPSNSVIYTKSKAIADKFVTGTYTSANTKIYYPPVINTQPVSQTITEGNSVTFSVATTAGNPSAMTYTWQYRTATGSWTNATATQGTGYDKDTFTIAKVTSDLDGNEYRCVVSTVGYPNEEMTSEELGLTSNAAVLSVNAPNYQVGSKYYNTLKEAVESITTTAETRIEVLLTNTEEDKATIKSTQNIVIDLNDKTINVGTLNNINDTVFIENKGTLKLTGTGTINMVNDNVEGRYGMINNAGTLNIESGTYSIKNLYTTSEVYMAVVFNRNDSTVTNMSGGNLIITNNNKGDASAIHGDYGIVNFSGGKIESTHFGITNNGKGTKQVLINVTGGEIYAKIGVWILSPSDGGQSNTKVTVSGNPSIISSGSCGIFNAYSTEPVVVTGGTIQGVRFGIDSLTSDIIVGTQGGEVSTSVPTVVGGEAAVYSNKTTYFYDGILKTNDKIHSGDIVPEPGYGLQYGTEGEYTTAILSTTNYTDGKSYYSSLQNAFEKAPSGATIKPTKDLTDNEKATLPAGKTMTLDLDGKTLTRADASIVNNGTFTITGNGSLNATVFSNEARDFIKNSGVLNITGGNIQIDNICTTQERYMNLINSETSNSTINITGGNITAQNDYAGWAAIVFLSKGSVNISGGTLTSSRHMIAHNGENDGAKINITGGEMYAGKHVIRLSKDSNTYPDINVEVKISGTAKLESTDSVITNYSSLTDIIIAGGTITSPTVYTAIYNTKSKTIIGTQGGGVSATSPVITGGDYGVNSSKGITFYDGILKGKKATHKGLLTPESGYGVQYGVDGNYKTAILVGANYYDGTSYYATLNDAFNMAASGATITVEKNLTDSVAATMPSGKNMLLDLNGKTLTRTAATINKGTLTISDSTATPGTITSTSTMDAIITNAGYLNIEKVTINANSTNIPSAINVTGGHVYFVSGNIYSKTIGIKSATGTSMNFGNDSDAVSTTVPMIQADGLAISSNTFNWYDGILKSKVESVYTGTTTEATHYSPDYGTETIGGVTYNTAWLARDQNYEINGNYYATLADVIAKETGGTIKLLRKCVDDSQAIFPAGRSFVLNLSNLNMEKNIYPIVNNGTLEITGDGRMLGLALEDGMIRNNGTLTLSGSITINSSDDSATYLKLILNAGTLNITGDVLVESTVRMHSGIYQTAGTTNMESGTVSVVDIDAGTFNMNGGIITYNALRFMPVGDNSVTIAAGATFNFNGGIVKANEAVPFVNNGTLQAPENHAIYYYTDGSYKCARVELGWDISVAQDGSIIGYLVPNGDNYTLEVVGSGGYTKAYGWLPETAAPWYTYREQITEITISEGIEGINAYVFAWLPKIKSVILPESLEYLGTAAFDACTELTETIIIPANVKTIPGNPFVDVPLTNLIVAEGNTNFKVLNNMLMTADGKRIITYFIGKTDKFVELPTGVTILSLHSFQSVKAEKITLPSTLTTIERHTFRYSNLKELVIPVSVAHIGNDFVTKSNNLANIYFLGTNFALDGENHFADIAPNSAIYTRSAAVASKFVDGTHYDSSLTTVYYPPVVGGTLLDTTVNSMKTVTFEVTVTPGVPNSVKYNWQVKRANTTEWVGLIDGQGLGTSEYTTTQLTVNNSGDEYRCIINGMNGTNEVYPNTYMPITDSDMTEKLISDTAKVYVRAANYLVNEEYFETLEDAVAAVPAGTATTIKLLTNLDDNSSVTIPADRNVTLDIQSFTLNREDEKITNNGTLNITGTGTLKVESATLVDNKGTLKITQAATKVVSTSTSAVAIINSGSVELNKLSLTTVYTAIQSTGNVTINGGTYLVNGTKASVTISAIRTEGGTVDIQGGTFNVTNNNENAIGIYAVKNTVINMSAGEVTTNGIGAKVEVSNTFTMTGGTISANVGIENYGTSSSVIIGKDDGSVYDNSITIVGEEYGYYANAIGMLYFYDGTIKGKTRSMYRESDGKLMITTPDEYDVNYSHINDEYEWATLVRANYHFMNSWFATLNDVFKEMLAVEPGSDLPDAWEAPVIVAGENFTTITDTEVIEQWPIYGGKLTLKLMNDVAIEFENTIAIPKNHDVVIIGEGALGTINATVVNNGTLDLKANLTGTLTNNGTATIGATSGTLVNTVSGSITNTGAMTINKTTVTGSVTSSGSALTLNGGTLNGGVTMSSACKFTMTSGAVNKSNGVAVTNSGTGAIEILSGAITGTTYGINNTGTGTITIGSLTNGVISSGDPIITGGTYGVKTSADFNFYDGMLRGKTGSYQGTVTAVEEGTHIKKDTPEGNGTDYHRAYIESNDVFVEVWDISKTAGTDEVYAGVKVVEGDGINADTRYKLVVWGTGATKDFEYTYNSSVEGDYEVNNPWHEIYGQKIIELELKEGVTRYGDNLFFGLRKVSVGLILPSSLTSIGERAFGYLESFSGNVEIPRKLIEIDNKNPFAATKITTFSVAEGNLIFEVKDKGLYHVAEKRLIAYPGGFSNVTATIDEGTLIIGAYAFLENKIIKTAQIPLSTTTIGEGAFKNSRITEIIIPKNVTQIGDGAFDLTRLNKVYLKTKILEILSSDRAFARMPSGSIIYTESKEIADLFIPDKTYTAANTSIYYPFKVLEMPEDFALTINDSIKIEPTIRNGNPTNDVVYQWYLNGNPIAGANSATYTKPTVVDSDSGDYQVLIKSALQEDGTYYYSHMSEKTNLRVRDHVGPESVSISVSYFDDDDGVGFAQVTVTASDTYSGVDKFYVNDVELTSGVTITNDGTGLTGGSGVAVFDIKTKGEYRISVADAEDNRTNRTINAYLIEYLPGSDYQVTGDTKSQIAIGEYWLSLRECGYVKTGHTFTGWKEQGDMTYPSEWLTPLHHWNIQENKQMTAQWQINTYTVEFYNDAGEGPVLVERKQYNYEEIIDVPELQYHVAEMVGEDQYKIYRHKNNWKATTLDDQSVFKAEDINADNINSIWMVDSNVRYDATYTVTTYDIGNATVYLDGNMSVSGTNAAIQNDEGVIFIGPLPTITIYGPVYNNNGLIFDNR